LGAFFKGSVQPEKTLGALEGEEGPQRTCGLAETRGARKPSPERGAQRGGEGKGDENAGLKICVGRAGADFAFAEEERDFKSMPCIVFTIIVTGLPHPTLLGTFSFLILRRVKGGMKGQ